jgi:polar amino acid transport system substrate-binding protein
MAVGTRQGVVDAAIEETPVVKPGNKFGILILALIFAGLFGASDARARQQPSYMGFEFYPFGYVEDEKRIAGLLVDIVREIGRRSGVEIELRIAPIPRALKEFTDGNVDLIITGSTRKPFASAQSLGIVGCHRTVVVPRSASNIKRIADLRGKSIGFARGGIHIRRFGKRFGIDAVPTNSSESMVSMLIRGRIDGFIMSDILYAPYINGDRLEANVKNELQEIVGDVIALEFFPNHLRVSKKSRLGKVAQALTKALDEARAAGSLEKIYRKYGVVTGGRCPVSQ